MKDAIIRLAAMAMLAVTLFAGLAPGKMEEKEDTGITVEGTYDWEEVYIYIRSARARYQADGKYLVEVEFTTDTAKGLTGMRMVTVFCGEQRYAFALTEENLADVHRTCFSVPEQPETIRVEVRAHQTESGLLLISDGEGQLCGQAAAPIDGDRILRVSGASPCGTYLVYRIGALSDVLCGTVVLSEKPTVKELEAYGVSSCYATMLTAEADGTAECNFTQENLKDGIYLVVGEGENFYVCLPLVEASGVFISSVARICLE